ncbi:uncharacterized protein LOC6652229 isoform X6 [Drosophila willistoni]|uniref:uncharacterized protein LOC6652229 isoform X6 n=1 Tax=Drosophila willistoni TaxID=7260 RepID=UPI000C26C354|nr:uncharacterized protein LOC6652229 isoform X6 [Drosophila willistoni]
MDLFIIYVAVFFLLFLIMPIVYFLLQFLLWIIVQKCCGIRSRGSQNHRSREFAFDRQGTVYSVSDDRPHNRYGDIFFIEPGSEEANRIREQLEKDEKDLPSYDEVMRMCNLTTPTAAAAVAGTAQLPPTIDGNLAIGIAALPAPPYSEADPQASPSQTSAFAVPASNPPSINAISMEPSTSRAAQTPTSPASVTVTLPSTVTNTEV